MLMQGWPWLGLGLALVALVVGVVRGGGWLRDPRRLVWLGLPLYMLHQFEEHGIDLTGRRYAFQASLCHTIGHQGPLATCAATEGFIFAVNVGSVWIAMSVAGVAGPKRATFTLAALGIPVVNAVAHIVPAVRTGTYNPGLATAVLLFLPVCALLARELLRTGLVTRRELVLVPLAGVGVHAVLLGSLFACAAGAIGQPALVAIQIANGFLPVVLGLVAYRLGRAARGGMGR